MAALDQPFLLDGPTLDVEASIGAAVYPDHGSDPEELLQHADIAMYVAKETHAGFVLFESTLDRPVPPTSSSAGSSSRRPGQRHNPSLIALRAGSGLGLVLTPHPCGVGCGPSTRARGGRR